MSNDLVEKKAEIISANDDGVLVPRTIDDSYRLAKYFHLSGMLPQRYNSPEMIMTAMQFACELKLKPLTALRQIAVIKGTPSIYGDLPLAICYASGMVEWIKEVYIDLNGKEISLANGNILAQVYGSATQVKRKNDPEIGEGLFTIPEATNAGLMGSDVWKKYTKIMLRYRARAQALKGKFPDALNGVSIAEYDFADPGDIENGEPPKNTKERIQELNTILDEQKKNAPKIIESEVVETKPEVKKEEPKPDLISDAQVGRMIAIQKEYFLPIELVKDILKSFGFKTSKEVTKDKYDEIVKIIEDKGKEKKKADEAALAKLKADKEKEEIKNKKPGFTLPPDHKPEVSNLYTTDEIPW